jgi:hypothetical protein
MKFRFQVGALTCGMSRLGTNAISAATAGTADSGSRRVL